MKDYDEAIDFYVNKLKFELVEDTYQAEQDKRWVVISPPGSRELARASKPEQDDFWRDYNRMVSDGIKFVREPQVQDYGTVAVFEDLYGNLWNLLELSAVHPMAIRTL
ncbi:Glyoxalase-like domain protein [Photobacterium piscicola]|uniref:Glyoxalase-like domain protein n=1 Tax=Photobacterium piscicola TaxID=1378299 RepID=A0A1T5HXI5_9GAMM|nr:Glyoxalase-like domain protein [Photobacterium piscicola]